jgi:hypothetical protein
MNSNSVRTVSGKFKAVFTKMISYSFGRTLTSNSHIDRTLKPNNQHLRDLAFFLNPEFMRKVLMHSNFKPHITVHQKFPVKCYEVLIIKKLSVYKLIFL